MKNQDIQIITKNIFGNNLVSVENKKEWKKSYERLVNSSFNKELQGYVPDQNENVTNIHSLVLDLSEKYKEVVVFAVDAISFKHFVKAGLDFAPKQSYFGTLTSVFPSTTGTAWPSIVMGTSPSDHAVYGTSFLLEGVKKNYIWISGTLNHKGSREQVDSKLVNLSLSKEKNIFEKLKEKGVNSYYIGTHGLGDENVFRELITRGAIHHEKLIPNYQIIKRNPDSFIDYFTKNTSKYLSLNKERKLIWNYIDLDDFAHEKGYKEIEDSLFWKKMFEYWKANENKERVFVLISDHGQTEQAKFEYSILRESESNDDLEYNTGGAGRVLYFYPKQGKEEAVEKWLKTIFSGNGDVYRKKDLIEKFNLFDIQANGIDRIGEFVVIAKTNEFPSVGCVDYIQEHGALNEDEMFVPILIFNKENE